MSSIAPKPLSGINNIKLREITCSLKCGTIPKDSERIPLLGFIALYYYAAEKHLQEGMVELFDPSTDDSVIIESLHRIWYNHAERLYEKNSMGVQQKFDDIKRSLNPHLYVYEKDLAIRIMAKHHVTVPKYKCEGCKKRYFLRRNRLRCESSHPVSQGKMQSTSSSFERSQVAKWWDTLSYEERYDIIGAESIRYGFETPVYHRIEAIQGTFLIDLLQDVLEGTALNRLIHAMPPSPMEMVSMTPNAICNRMIHLYVLWCSDTILTMEQQEFLKARQRRLKSLLKKARISDNAFKQLTDFASTDISWDIEEECDEEENVCENLRGMKITTQ